MTDALPLKGRLVLCGKLDPNLIELGVCLLAMLLHQLDCVFAQLLWTWE